MTTNTVQTTETCTRNYFEIGRSRSNWTYRDMQHFAQENSIRLLKILYETVYIALAYENICFCSLFAAGNVSRGVPSGEEQAETAVFAG